jgi:hypothetical protein
MSYDQTTVFLKKTDQFDIFPTSVCFFVLISCVSLLFNNMATGLMVDVRNSRKKQWGQDHLNLQLSELAATIEDCKCGAPYYWNRIFNLFRKVAVWSGLSKNKTLGPFQTYSDQYYVLAWINGRGTISIPSLLYLF